MGYELKNFQKDVLEKNIPVLVDFWASWCGPCKALGPVLEQAAAQAKGEWELVKINVDYQQDLAAKYNIQSIPSVKLFNKGQVVAEFVGVKNKKDLEAWLKNNLPAKTGVT